MYSVSCSHARSFKIPAIPHSKVLREQQKFFNQILSHTVQINAIPFLRLLVIFPSKHNYSQLDYAIMSRWQINCNLGVQRRCNLVALFFFSSVRCSLKFYTEDNCNMVWLEMTYLLWVSNSFAGKSMYIFKISALIQSYHETLNLALQFRPLYLHQKEKAKLISYFVHRMNGKKEKYCICNWDFPKGKFAP